MGLFNRLKNDLREHFGISTDYDMAKHKIKEITHIEDVYKAKQSINDWNIDFYNKIISYIAKIKELSEKRVLVEYQGGKLSDEIQSLIFTIKVEETNFNVSIDKKIADAKKLNILKDKNIKTYTDMVLKKIIKDNEILNIVSIINGLIDICNKDNLSSPLPKLNTYDDLEYVDTCIKDSLGYTLSKSEINKRNLYLAERKRASFELSDEYLEVVADEEYRKNKRR